MSEDSEGFVFGDSHSNDHRSLLGADDDQSETVPSTGGTPGNPPSGTKPDPSDKDNTPVDPSGTSGTSGTDKPRKRDTDTNWYMGKVPQCPVTLGLYGQNFISWKSLMPIYLQMDDDVWKVVNGTLVEPVPTPPSTKLSDDQLPELKRYQNANKKARVILFSSMNDRLIIQEFYGQTQNITAANIWESLEKKFGSRMALRQGTAITQLMSFKFKKNKSIDENLERFKTLQNQLADSGIEIDPKVQTEKLLSSLPPMWDALRLAWAARSDDDKDLNSLIQIIKTESIRQDRNAETLDDVNALVTNLRIGQRNFPNRRNQNRHSGQRQAQNQHRSNAGNGQYQPRPRRGRPGMRNPTQSNRCYNCGGQGHFKSQCRRPRRNMGNTRPNRQQPRNPRANAVDAQEPEAFMAQSIGSHFKSTSFLVDSGASHHMIGSRKWFTQYVKGQGTRDVRLASNQRLKVAGQGEACLTAKSENKLVDLELKNVLLVPRIRKNLLSISQLTDDGFEIKVKNDELTMIKNKIAIKVPKVNGLYRLKANLCSQQYTVNNAECAPVQENEASGMTVSKPVKENSKAKQSLISLHRRYAHINKEYIKKFLDSQSIKYIDDFEQCDSCVQGKQTRASYHSKPFESKAKKPGTVYADLCTMPTETLGNAKHFLMIVDEYSKFCKVYFLKNKGETAYYVEKYVKWFQNLFGYDIQRFHSDGGREFQNETIQEILHKAGAEQTSSCARTPAQTGLAERAHRTFMNLTRTVMIAAGLEDEKPLWGEAMNYVTTVWNMIVVQDHTKKTAYEVFYGKKAYVSKLREFGAKCYVLNKDVQRGKLQKRGKPVRLVGYLEHSLGYRVWDEETDTIERTKDVVFEDTDKQETAKPKKIKVSNAPQMDENTDDETSESSMPQSSAAADASVRPRTSLQVRKRDSQGAVLERKIINTEGHDTQYVVVRPDSPMPDTGPQAHVHEIDNALSDDDNTEKVSIGYKEPSSYHEAITGPERHFWLAAIQEELDAMKKLSVWEEAKLPPGRKAISTKWCFRRKVLDPKVSNSLKYRARLVARGFAQTIGIDCFPDKISSPVARSESVRAVFSIAAQEKLHLYQFDVRAAFLTAELEEEIYIEVPDGLKGVDKGKSLRLLKSIYGLRQSGFAFNKKFTKILKGMHLQQAKTEPCLFMRNERPRTIVCIFVDDGLLAIESKSAAAEFIEQLKKELEITYSPMTYFLGLQIERGEDFSVHIHQTKFINETLERFGMKDCKPASTPCDRSIYGLESQGPCTEEEYRSLIGTLLFAACGTRADIAFCVSYLSRFLDRCTPEHIQAAYRVLRYLKSCPSLGITYRSEPEQGIQVYSDADWASDPEKRKSTSGTLIIRNDGPVIWQTIKQSNISLSSCEAEFIAASETAKAVKWLTKLLSELGIEEKITMKMDSTSAIALIKSTQSYRRSKHIEIKYHFVREMYENKEIDIEHVSSEELKSDFLTKPLVPAKFLKQRELSGLQTWKQ